ncbi:MAG: hypothetical protein GWQ05_23650 [Verrucomicrobiaceae bacterium]|nr:hypothetical protein [Verrucomicrobiaceae bacterium]
MARLIAARGHSTEFHSGKVTLGEGPGVDVTLTAGLGIAKVHAELHPLLGGYVIKHVGAMPSKHWSMTSQLPPSQISHLETTSASALFLSP